MNEEDKRRAVTSLLVSNESRAMSMKEMAEATGIKRDNVYTAIMVMYKAGLIERLTIKQPVTPVDNPRYTYRLLQFAQ